MTKTETLEYKEAVRKQLKGTVCTFCFDPRLVKQVEAWHTAQATRTCACACACTCACACACMCSQPWLQRDCIGLQRDCIGLQRDCIGLQRDCIGLQPTRGMHTDAGGRGLRAALRWQRWPVAMGCHGLGPVSNPHPNPHSKPKPNPSPNHNPSPNPNPN
jgi:hypothetical protein